MGHIDNLVDEVLYALKIEDSSTEEQDKALRKKLEQQVVNILEDYTSYIADHPTRTFQECLEEYIQKHIK